MFGWSEIIGRYNTPDRMVDKYTHSTKLSLSWIELWRKKAYTGQGGGSKNGSEGEFEGETCYG